MSKTILVFIFYLVLSAVCLYLFATLAATFFIFEWRLSVFNMAMWDIPARFFFLFFVIGFALLGFVNNSINKHLYKQAELKQAQAQDLQSEVDAIKLAQKEG